MPILLMKKRKAVQWACLFIAGCSILMALVYWHPNKSKSRCISLHRVVVFVSIRAGADPRHVWAAWGHKLVKTKSLELYSLNPNVSPDNEPVVVPTRFPNLSEVQWNGAETGTRQSMTLKTKKMFETCLTRHPDRDWFIKTDEDTMVVVELMQKLLSRYSSAVPWYMGFTWPKGLWQTFAFNSGAFYILSKAAVHRMQPYLLSQHWNATTAFKYEDAMIAIACGRAGILPLNLAPYVYFSRPEARAKRYPRYAHVPFIAVHNLKDPRTLVSIGAVVDAFNHFVCP